MKFLSSFRSLSQLLVVAAICCCCKANAQRYILNMPEHDQKPYYFGITFGMNWAVMKPGAIRVGDAVRVLD